MAKLKINADHVLGKINKEIYGHFSEHLGRCIYEGLYVGEDSQIENVNGMRTDVIEALKEIQVPVLRWPGGCFADEYHWKDGIGPKDGRKKMINTHWGGVVEDNSFGTHEYFELCRQLGCESYVNGNLGSGTVQEMSEWVEYMTFDGVSPMADLRTKNGHEEPWRVHYFGVGNENWGCGGNMNPDFYANEYRRYQTYVRDYHQDYRINKICCGPNVDDYEWTRKVLETCFAHGGQNAHGFMNGLSLHYYTVPGEDWQHKGSATNFDEKEYYRTLHIAYYMEELVRKHGAIMDEFDPKKEIGLMVDEWGTWYDVEPGTNPGFLYQQNTMRDALVAALTLNIFNKHCDRVKMANIAQMVNVLQSVILTDGAQMVKTPTWSVFRMYRDHQDAQLVESSLESAPIGLETKHSVPNLSESVSVDADGVLHITVANLSLSDAYDIDVEISGCAQSRAAAGVSAGTASAGNVPVGTASAGVLGTSNGIRGEILTGAMTDKNTFEAPEAVKIAAFDGVKHAETGLTFTIPACSVVHLAI
ncbi:MAG: alpha-N-arabinofuranosidase [Lachnospiraceae bacterium]|nr:alpha-N-arabinofuranosidase [Lachnospiraceae bacterium]